MPRYDYLCQSCGQEFELTQSFSEAGSGTCPDCSGAGRRVFHAVPVIYKGSGFYTTDYGRPKAPPEEKAPVETKSKDSKDNSTKSSDNGSSDTSKTKSEPAPKAGSEVAN